MFERFTERARQVVVLAQEEARNAPHSHIGTEHLVLGVLREEHGVGGQALVKFIDVEEARRRVMEIVPAVDNPPSGQIPFTPLGKRVLELALREALALGHNYIGTEHILLALCREEQGPHVEVLKDIDRVELRNATIRLLIGPGQRRPTVLTQAARKPLAPSMEARLTDVLGSLGQMTAIVAELLRETRAEGEPPASATGGTQR